MESRNTNHVLLRAMILGRVERLLGRDCDINPFPDLTRQWEAFREGWLRALDDPISIDSGKKVREQPALEEDQKYPPAAQKNRASQ